MPSSLVPEQLIELAKKAGADQAEVYQSRTLTRPVFYEANRLKQIEVVEAEGTALRLWQAGRPGLAVGYGAVDPQYLVRRALALSQLNPPEQVEISSGICEIYPDVGQPLEEPGRKSSSGKPAAGQCGNGPQETGRNFKREPLGRGDSGRGLQFPLRPGSALPFHAQDRDSGCAWIPRRQGGDGQGRRPDPVQPLV